MGKKMIQKTRLTRRLKTVRINETLPFQERPSRERSSSKKNPPNNVDQLQASQLFCLFTADIIKQDVIFTR